MPCLVPHPCSVNIDWPAWSLKTEISSPIILEPSNIYAYIEGLSIGFYSCVHLMLYELLHDNLDSGIRMSCRISLRPAAWCMCVFRLYRPIWRLFRRSIRTSKTAFHGKTAPITLGNRLRWLNASIWHLLWCCKSWRSTWVLIST